MSGSERRLSELCAGLTAEVAADGADRVVGAVRDDSRAVTPGDVFVAVPGTRGDGRAYVEAALAAGAAAVVSVRGTPAEDAALAARARAAGAALVWVADARRALAVLAARAQPDSLRPRLLAVTGTNGKTTTTHLVEAMLSAAGRSAGMIGTVVYRYPGVSEAAPLTTPGALALHGLLARMHGAGVTDVVLEASSHALHQGRLAACRFAAAGLTNVTQDHLDYHGTMEAYFDAKAILFESLLRDDGVAVLHLDREDGRRMRARVRGRVLGVVTDPSAAGPGAELVVERRELDATGVRASLRGPTGPFLLRSALVGEYNLQNLCLAAGMALAIGLPADAIQDGMALLDGVPGRLERIENSAGVLCAVDYAHTPDALERALSALRPLTRGRLLAVFGCGGDRDPGKRPLMGEVAARLADVVVVTSDNPRSEDPGRILDMIVPGIERGGLFFRAAGELASARGALLEPDRRRAIQRAVALARPGDTLLIAGKGHEDYQVLATGKIHFDDREEARAAFAARATGGVA